VLGKKTPQFPFESDNLLEVLGPLPLSEGKDSLRGRLYDLRIIPERFLQDHFSKDVAQKVSEHVNAKRAYLEDLLRQGRDILAPAGVGGPAGGGGVSAQRIPSTDASPGTTSHQSAPQSPRPSFQTDGHPESNALVVEKVRKCLSGLQACWNDLDDLLNNMPQGVSASWLKQLHSIFVSCNDNEQVAQAVYAPVCEWAFVLWPVLLANDPLTGGFQGTVRFQRQEALESSLHRQVPSNIGDGAPSFFRKSAKHAKKPDGHAILELPHNGSTFEYTIMLQESKDIGLSNFEDDFVKACKEAKNSIGFDCNNWQIPKPWCPRGGRPGMRASPYPPKYIFQVTGVELHVFAVEALERDVAVVYQVAAGSLENKQIDSEKQNRLPSASVTVDSGNLLFISYAILRQLQDWLHAIRPNIAPGQGNVVAALAPVTPAKAASGDGSVNASNTRNAEAKTAASKAGGPGTSRKPNVGNRKSSNVLTDVPASFRHMGVYESLESRFVLGDVVWEHPNSGVIQAVRRADNREVVVKRCRFETALATVRADYLLRSAAVDSQMNMDGENRAGAGIDVSRDSTSYIDIVVPVLEFFFDPVPQDSKSLRMATLVFPRLSEVTVPAQTVLRQQRDEPVAPEALAWFWDFAIQLADRVSALHSLQLSHGDLKPLNVMIDEPSGRVVLIDMGQSQYPLDSGTLHYTHGTRHWRPPELVSFNFACSDAADRWGLGAVILHALFSAMNALAFDEAVDGPYDHEDVDEACDQLQQLYDDAEWVKALRATLEGCFGPSFHGHLRYSAARMREELQMAFELYSGNFCVAFDVASSFWSCFNGPLCFANRFSWDRVFACYHVNVI